MHLYEAKTISEIKATLDIFNKVKQKSVISAGIKSEKIYSGAGPSF